jgi:AcrR family transcriptional regulator
VAKAGPRAKGAGGGGRSAETRAALVSGAIEALRTAGFSGASAREIARLAGCNQTLIFYHFGSVNDLLLAALDAVSEQRLAAYRAAFERAGSLSELVESARSMFEADLDSGHVAVLVEMIAAARSVPGLGEQVAARIAPARAFAQAALRDAVDASPFARLLPSADAAHAVVAGFLGLEMLANLDGDRAAALALFDRASVLAALADMAGALPLPGAPGATGTTRATGAPPAPGENSGG